MKNIVSSFVLILSINFTFGQTPKLVIKNPTKTKLGFNISYQVANGDSTTRFYRITKTAFCEGLAMLKVIDCKSKTEKLYFPCKGLISLKSVIFNDKNSFLLDKDKLFKATLLIDLKDISPSLIKGHTYEIQLSFNYSNIPTEKNGGYFNGNLTSNKSYFKY